MATFPLVTTSVPNDRMTDVNAGGQDSSRGQIQLLGSGHLGEFVSCVSGIRSVDFVKSLWGLVHYDTEVAQSAWLEIFPRAWTLIPAAERLGMESALEILFTKEYHSSQMLWPRSVLPVLLDGASRCEPLPVVRPEILMHIGIRWNAWFHAVPYLERRAESIRSDLAIVSKGGDEREIFRLEGELESVLDAVCDLYRRLKEKDMFAAVWKRRSDAPGTAVGLCLEQQGLFADAQQEYGILNTGATEFIESRTYKSSSASVQTFRQEAMQSASGTPGFPVSRGEVCLWESR